MSEPTFDKVPVWVWKRLYVGVLVVLLAMGVWGLVREWSLRREAERIRAGFSPVPSSLVLDLGAGEEKRAVDFGPGISWAADSTKPFIAFSVMEETGARGPDHRMPAGDSGWGGETKKGYLVVRGLEPETRIRFFRK